MVPEHLRSRQSAEVTLESGLKVGIQLPNARDFIHAGNMAWPVLERMAELEKKEGSTVSELSDEERGQLYEFQKRMVAKTITALPNEAGELESAEVTPDDLGFLTDAEFYELVQYFMRTKDLPGKVA